MSCRFSDEPEIRRPGVFHDPTRLAISAVSTEQIHIEETDTTFATGWKGRYRIDGPAFVYSDRDTGRVTTILGYPTNKLSQIG
jgi:hypothetical protein